MQPRIDYPRVDPKALQTLLKQEHYAADSDLEQSLLDLVKVRASQINHCAFCLDMHVKEARASGETEQRLYSLDAWRETPFYSERERAALAWTEAVTVLTDGFVPDSVYGAVREQFTEQEIISLTMAVIAINGWNRINVSMRTVPGRYQSQRTPEPALTAASGND
jgi:AhpD family alkylhydroperoxidase